MTPRAHWKGFLKLSLVSCPVALYPAISAAERISFRQVNKETGNRLRQQLVDTATGEVIASYNKGRGYEVGENEFLVVEHEELAAVQREARERPFNSPAARSLTTPPTQKQPVKASEPTRRAERAREETASPIVSPPEPPRPIVENNRTIELDRFVRPKEIDAAYYNMPYFIVPRDAVGQEAFAVIRDAMAHKKLVGLGRVVLASRERPILIEPMGSGLRGITLRYEHEVRDAAVFFSDIAKLALPDEMLEITEHILDTKTENFDPVFLEDRYRSALVEKLREKQAGRPVTSVAPAPSRQNVVNLMDALKRSLAKERPSAPLVKPTQRRAAAVSTASSAKRSPARARKAG